MSWVICYKNNQKHALLSQHCLSFDEMDFPTCKVELIRTHDAAACTTANSK